MNRPAARKWIKRYLAEALRHRDGLAAALPVTRDQVIGEDPENSVELSGHPSWSLGRNGQGNVVVAWLDSDEEEIIEIRPSLP